MSSRRTINSCLRLNSTLSRKCNREISDHGATPGLRLISGKLLQTKRAKTVITAKQAGAINHFKTRRSRV